ncbi:hypothetical protein KSD_56600 [Ktedonobacter sp. SOSP1-85]|nr:hypothetical protein KSD_56600 [Ktedonobacter sp. SOSP1-85]
MICLALFHTIAAAIKQENGNIIIKGYKVISNEFLLFHGLTILYSEPEAIEYYSSVAMFFAYDTAKERIL